MLRDRELLLLTLLHEGARLDWCFAIYIAFKAIRPLIVAPLACAGFLQASLAL